MPPRPSSTLVGSFSVTDANNEVVCPLQNQDGSQCRKRCLGEKRYRSMQEHIRRAHPEYYIPKLPATKDSFDLMITSPPHERPAQDPNHANHNNHNHNHNHHIQQHDMPGLSPAYLDGGLGSSYQGYHALGQHDGGYYTASDAEASIIYSSMQAQQRDDTYRRGSIIPAASAAAALAQLHYHRGPDSDWGPDQLGQVISFPDDMSPTNTEADLLQAQYGAQHDMKDHGPMVDPALDDSSFMQDQLSYQPTFDHSQAGMLPNNLATSPPERPATMSTLQRSASRNYNRPRKHSLGQARLPKHERKRSKDLAKRISGDKSGISQLYGKRWEDLIDAAQSATEEEDSRDLTPVPQSPYQSPQVNSRTSLPPPFGAGAQFQSFQASPLNRALTPPSGDQAGLDLQHFPSVDSTLSSNFSHQHHNSTDSHVSGEQYHIMNPSSMESTSSPMFTSGNQVQIYCAGCKRLSILKDSFACTQCICGLCGNCTEALISEQSRGRMSSCPDCHAIDSSFKPFRLEVR